MKKSLTWQEMAQLTALVLRMKEVIQVGCRLDCSLCDLCSENFRKNKQVKIIYLCIHNLKKIMVHSIDTIDTIVSIIFLSPKLVLAEHKELLIEIKIKH